MDTTDSTFFEKFSNYVYSAFNGSIAGAIAGFASWHGNITVFVLNFIVFFAVASWLFYLHATHDPLPKKK